MFLDQPDESILNREDLVKINRVTQTVPVKDVARSISNKIPSE